MKDWREWLIRVPVFRKLIFQAELGRSREMITQITLWLPPEPVLDIGTGSGVLAHLLQQAGHDITALDVRDTTVTAAIDPIISDGQTLPFNNNAFGTALILYVLHHTPAPDTLITEAARIARRVIILEDVITGKVQSLVTKSLDSLVNLEFFGHPHSNRSHQAWLQTFTTQGIPCLATETVTTAWWPAKPMRHQLYVLDTSTYGGTDET